jgi:hypothetical protein
MRQKPGPKGVLPNPRPIDVPNEQDVVVLTTTEIEPADIDADERALRAYFAARRDQLVRRRDESLSAAALRIGRLAAKALSETGRPWWSGHKRWHVVPSERRPSVPWGRGGARRHVGPEPPPRAEHKCLWLDTSRRPFRVKRYDRHAGLWREERWLEGIETVAALVELTGPLRSDVTTSWPGVILPLRGPVARMLAGQMGRAGKSGRPAYLAYATLAALLDTTPEKIADVLNNYRRRPRARR